MLRKMLLVSPEYFERPYYDVIDIEAFIETLQMRSLLKTKDEESRLYNT